MIKALSSLQSELEGELFTDDMVKRIYATDASAYREIPLAVAQPKNDSDIRKLIAFAKKHKTSLIPRAAGTSLAGQCVGAGIVVDISKHFIKILEVNVEEKWVRVQAGVVRDELNAYLHPYGLFFSPITSTANRAMIGGMVGNNSSGTSSIEYGTTRDHVLEIHAFLSDGSDIVCKELNRDAFLKKIKENTLEGQLYQQIYTDLSAPETQINIHENFPKASIHRRNTGYAVDALLKNELFSDETSGFNFCKLLCGSEGTLAFTTEIKLALNPLPKAHQVVLAAHFESIHQSLLATQIAMKHQPSACELMDKIILDCTKENIEQRKNRYFIEGDPQAVLMVEFRADSDDEAKAMAQSLISDLQRANLGFAFPIIPQHNTKRIWALRAAGLGLLANIPGDKKAVTCIEDTAVDIDDLPQYIEEFTAMLEGFGQKAVYYAHAGAGEIHLRPILNLKKSSDVVQFHEISEASARLVKKYRGSLSGEHGDGRLRAEFIPMMVGDKNYQFFLRIKKTWDPDNIFNPGKIVEAKPMVSDLRYETDQAAKSFTTLFDFSDSNNILEAAEKCNGSGDCRKSAAAGGTMCPSYQATRNEKDTTRARANILREYLSKSPKENPFDHPEIKEVLDLCLSCKACASECPSNVDMARLKAEFQFQYYKSNRMPLRAKVFARINQLNAWGSRFPSVYNFGLTNPLLSRIPKAILGIAPQRTLPKIQKQSLYSWFHSRGSSDKKTQPTKKKVFLFCDEFTNYQDTKIGQLAVLLLESLAYDVRIIKHPESGRAALSKGDLLYARKCAEENVSIFQDIIDEEVPLIGIEPSAILSFRDEYPQLVKPELRESAKALASHCLLIEEFLAAEIQAGRILPDSFTQEEKQIHFHGHCHQKALSETTHSLWVLSLPINYHVELIPSGCCGMAGSFGYEAEHYTVSQQIGELVLFPAVRKTNNEAIIAANGTSCRHQIWDGTQRKAYHPVEILYEALKK